jgi:hypothetical protein
MNAWLWKWGAILFGALALVNVSAVVLYAHKLHNEQASHARTSLDLSNAQAAAETTRTRLVDSLTRVSDRAALQIPQKPDAVDRALKSTRIAIDSLRAVIRALNVHAQSTGDVVTTTSATGDTVRHATFNVRDAPYTARADVALPARGRGSIDLSVSLDTIPLTVRPSCSDADANGIRAARVSVSAPPWATVLLARVEQDASLCHSPAIEQAAGDASAAHDRRLRLALVVGYGATMGATLPVHVGQGVFVGVAFAKPLPLPRWIPFH